VTWILTTPSHHLSTNSLVTSLWIGSLLLCTILFFFFSLSLPPLPLALLHLNPLDLRTACPQLFRLLDSICHACIYPCLSVCVISVTLFNNQDMYIKRWDALEVSRREVSSRKLITKQCFICFTVLIECCYIVGLQSQTEHHTLLNLEIRPVHHAQF
jgi:hypothetical protein